MVQVSEWNFDQTYLQMLIIMVMNSESASVNLKVTLRCAVLHYNIRISPWLDYFFSWLFSSILARQSGHSHVWFPRKFLDFRGYEIASETIYGPIRCSSEDRRQRFTCMNIYPFCTLRRRVYSSYLFRPSNCSLISQATPFANEACETVIAKTVSCWKENSVFCTIYSHLSSFNMSPVFLGALHGHPPSNGANWRRQ